MAKARLIEATGALARASVIVTRPAAAAAALKRRVRALGGTAIGLPGIALRQTRETAPVKTALAAARTADIAIFVSPSAVKFAFGIRPTLRFARATAVCAL